MELMSYIIIVLLLLAIIIFAFKAYAIFKFGMQKTYQLTGKQIFYQYIFLICLALSILVKYWDKIMQQY
jgi:hypothetical protein